jgi:histidine triad (HIT) family protein
MNTDCLFCRIVAGAIPVTRVYEDERVLVFPDINPQAPVHLLVIPKAHHASLAHTGPEDDALLGYLLAGAAHVANELGLAAGYRVVVNTGDDGGQTVEHLHLHVLGGRAMGWPPG